MRVVAGKARSILLETPKGNGTRPTTDRIKETLFNMLQGYCPGAVVLDLFAGSGGLGIEALSRGADYACFADQDRNAVKCITGNVERAGFKDCSDVYQSDYQSTILRLKGISRKFDLVFLDPPYDMELEFKALKALVDADLLTDDCLVVVEAKKEHDPQAFADMGFDIKKQKIYKSNQHYFLVKHSEEQDHE
ncbi:MAG: 16S rRNA (guanine(966)-N(2))-methyltransferase RsmD [Lachnospiraceae bacterium]|nr:16S rRNA (guanine(966)-N(2))-methyltransferase RsmD [Lachnospiraceae bacterium]